MTKRREFMTPEERERACAQRRAAYQRNREKEIAWARAYREANPEKVKAIQDAHNRNRKPYLAAYYVANRERLAVLHAAWKAANRERVAAVQAEYLQSNLDRHRVNQQNRRARKKANGGRLSPDIVQRLFTLQRGRCACCREPLGADYDLDHIVPLALGGANSDENVQLLRASCNRSKGARHPVDYMQAKGLLL